MTPEEFSAICLSRYGYGWQTRLANEISVNPRTVRRWASGEMEVPPAVAAAIQARPAIAIDYPDEWILADSAASAEEEREYLVHLHTPRFVGIVADDDAISSGITLALRDETIIDITWIDPPPTGADMKKLLRSLQAFLDSESR